MEASEIAGSVAVVCVVCLCRLFAVFEDLFGAFRFLVGCELITEAVVSPKGGLYA